MKRSTILPVIDLLGGEVVRGVGGRRSEYRPIQSQLVSGSNPVAIASAIRTRFQIDQFYVADLDGILSGRPNFGVYRELADQGFHLMLDAGIRNIDDGLAILEAGATELIVALEVCRSPQQLAEFVKTFPQLVFSVDLQNGRPKFSADMDGWSPDPILICGQAVDSGINQLLILDLADVGTGTGGSTDQLYQEVRRKYATIRLITGGGIRDLHDIERMVQQGIDSVLVASALHNGSLIAVAR